MGLPQLAVELGVSENTLRGWVRYRGLQAESYGRRALVRRSSMQRFVAANPQLPAASRALSVMDLSATTPSSAHGAPEEVPPPSTEDRSYVRELRARVATLNEELHAARLEVIQLRRDRDLWRARCRAHRHALRAQLDIEEHADQS
jgi:transposase-like protein